MSFKDGHAMAVRFYTDAEKHQLLDIVESLGMDAEKYRGGVYAFPNTTCTFRIVPAEKTIDYLGQPSICAVMAGNGVRFHSVPEFGRLAELGFPLGTRCPVFHVPHDGDQFPPELMRSVCVPEEVFLDYHEKMRDVGVWSMVPREYRPVPYQCERFKISRLLCDVERFIGPEEVMERYGMGFCYEKAFDGTKIKEVTDELKELTLRFYTEHHSQMDKICRKHHRMLLFDLHSYSDEIVPTDFLCEGVQTPDVCIGTDPRFTPPQLLQTAEEHLKAAGFSVALNYPYSGCYVPNSALAGESDCISIMLEFHKRIYLDQHGAPIEEQLERIRGVIMQILLDSLTL